jgi:RNA polymerase sigma factor (sigma-70 family)
MLTLLPQLARLCGAAPRSDAELLDQFLVRRDEAAFAALVQRHGPMVMGVCRRRLRHHGDAEDAFQATFLVLVRKAVSLTGQSSIAPWLHGVAQRTALKARGLAVKRAAWQQPLHAEPADRAAVDPDAWEWKCLLEEEVQRLPDKYRQPVLLCYMAGETKQAAAERLGLPEGTVSSRLARARETLHRRLTQRGIALTGAGLAGLLLPCSVSARLLHATTAAGVQSVRGLPLAVSSTVLQLSQGVMRAMVLGNLRRLGVAVFLLALGGLICGLNGQPSIKAAEPPQQPTVAKPAEAQGRIEGRITAADTGKPVAGVEVKALVQGMGLEEPLGQTYPTATSNAEGRYSLAVPLGHVLFGDLSAPAGYCPQEEKRYHSVVTTQAQPTVTRDFVLHPGTPWQLRLEGLKISSVDRPSFSALTDPRQPAGVEPTFMATTNDQGHAVLSLPPGGGRYRLSCYLGKVHRQYDGERSIRLETDKDFDPRQVIGNPEPLPEGKGWRLKDAAGRTAVVQGGAVSVEKGQAVLRFTMKPATDAAEFTLRGRVVDEAGAPLADARVTLLSEGNSGVPMFDFAARTDAQGQFVVPVRLRPSYIRSEWQLRMLIVKPGFHATRTMELNAVQTRQAGRGDFGTVTLQKGHTLRGTVVDENGQPFQGAIVSNAKDMFLYQHLTCRTDAAGRFTMPDLLYGSLQIGAQWGDLAVMMPFDFDERNRDFTITLKDYSKNPPAKPAAPSPAPMMQQQPRPIPPPVVSDEGWNLTPPVKEPQYQKEPRYALVVFGEKREQRVWMVLDGTTLYVDKNGNGDLTEPDERLEPNKPKDGGNRFAGSGSHTHYEVFEFTVQTAGGGSSKFQLNHWTKAEKFEPKTDFEKKAFAHRQKWRYENSTLWRKDGRGQGQTPLIFMPKPADVHVSAFDGPLTFVVKLPQYQVLKRGEAGSDLAFHIVTMGRPHRGAEQEFYNPLATTEVPAAVHLEVEIEYPPKAAGVPPVRRKYLLKERC